jgi:hypothetical protein
VARRPVGDAVIDAYSDNSSSTQLESAMKTILLWALGVPIPVILLLWLIF